jgi:hypothetical protein
MQKHVLVLTTSAFILAGGALVGADAQQGGDPMMQQPQVLQQRQELERQQDRAQSPRPRAEGGRDQDDDDRYGGRMTGGGWRYQQDWQRRVMDSDGDGTVSLQEFQAAHERIFKGMDANKDGRLTLEEMLAFMQGTRRSVP